MEGLTRNRHKFDLTDSVSDTGFSAASSGPGSMIPLRVPNGTMELHHVRRGSGSPLVLIDGLGSSWQTWNTVIEPLAVVREVVGIDLPGFGGDAEARWTVDDRDSRRRCLVKVYRPTSGKQATRSVAQRKGRVDGGRRSRHHSTCPPGSERAERQDTGRDLGSQLYTDAKKSDGPANAPPATRGALAHAAGCRAADGLFPARGLM